MHPPRAPPLAGAVPVVAMEHVTAAYGHAKVLDDVSFAVHAGQTVAVAGESGSGKSTAPRMITGLLQPATGGVASDGKLLPAGFRQRSRQQLRQIQPVILEQDASERERPPHILPQRAGHALCRSRIIGMISEKLVLNSIRYLQVIKPSQRMKSAAV